MKETYRIVYGKNKESAVLQHIEDPERIYPVDKELLDYIKNNNSGQLHMNVDFTVQWRTDGISRPVIDEGVKKDYKGTWYAIRTQKSRDIDFVRNYLAAQSYWKEELLPKLPKELQQKLEKKNFSLSYDKDGKIFLTIGKETIDITEHLQ